MSKELAEKIESIILELNKALKIANEEGITVSTRTKHKVNETSTKKEGVIDIMELELCSIKQVKIYHSK